MPLSPGCGETPLDGEELDALLPAVREALGDNPTRAAVFDLEQTVQDEVAEELLTSVIEGSLAWDELLADYFVRELHRRPRGHRSHPPFHRWQRAHDAIAGGPRVRRCPRHRHTRPVRLGPRQAPLYRPAARVRREPGSKRARRDRRTQSVRELANSAIRATASRSSAAGAKCGSTAATSAHACAGATPQWRIA